MKLTQIPGLCVECWRPMKQKKHFTLLDDQDLLLKFCSFLYCRFRKCCSKCNYRTNCVFSFQVHRSYHTVPRSLFYNSDMRIRKSALIKSGWRCNCGYSTRLGNLLSKSTIFWRRKILIVSGRCIYNSEWIITRYAFKTRNKTFVSS